MKKWECSTIKSSRKSYKVNKILNYRKLKWKTNEIDKNEYIK